MAEAEGLVNTLDNWTVVDKLILSTKTPEKKKIFGKGNFQLLTGIGARLLVSLFPCVCLCVLTVCVTSSSERIRQTGGVSAVFVNVDRLSPSSEVSPSERPSAAVLRDGRPSPLALLSE